MNHDMTTVYYDLDLDPLLTSFFLGFYFKLLMTCGIPKTYFTQFSIIFFLITIKKQCFDLG